VGFLIIIIFIAGYLAIVLEHQIKVNKAASAILTGVLCWTAYILSSHDLIDTTSADFAGWIKVSSLEKSTFHFVSHQLVEHLGDISGILFFLLGAMTIIELVDSHHGFEVITSEIGTNNKKKLLWIVAILTFFMSALLDNLTTSIVMVSLLRKLIKSGKGRMLYAGVVIIAANAGGAWTPIGDVTTTMLWIENKITTLNIMLMLFIPSFVSLLVPVLLLSSKLKGNFTRPDIRSTDKVDSISDREKNIVFYLGISVLIFVPIFKSITHLPPFMGMLFGLSVLWIVTEILHKKKEEKVKEPISVLSALRKVDVSSILFFLGILLAIGSLSSTGQLELLAANLEKITSSEKIIVLAIGLISSIVDNVPLVAAAMKMYSSYPADHLFWEFLAFCAGTGGSVLIIGSAAGVTVMGIERISFFWYVKKISPLALAGYFTGAAIYLSIYPLIKDLAGMLISP
jgi:Na+/H+ antiporter NhaD/arsenite permease-like protein